MTATTPATEIFDGKTTTVTDTPSPFQITDTVTSLVGEGKKFKDLDSALQGKIEADAFIERLTKENGDLRKVADKNITLEQVLEAIGKQTPPTKETVTTTTGTEIGGDIDARVQRILDERSTKERVTSNLTKVHDAMVGTHGDKDKAAAAIAAKAAELGTGVAELKELAARSPVAFLKLMDVEIKKGTVGPDITGTANTETLGTTGRIEPGTYAHYEKIRKENPKLYMTPKIQNQMHKDMERLGSDKFFGRK